MANGIGVGRLRLRLLSWVVLLAVVVGALATFFVSRSLIADQEQRLLRERAHEVGALLGNSFDSIESSLLALGPIGASDDPAARRLFEQSAERLLDASTGTIGVATVADGDVEVVTSVGDGARAGDALSGQRAALTERALTLEEPALVTDLVTDETGSRVLLALPIAGSDAVAYRESLVDPSQPVPSTPDSPFHELKVVLYASSEQDPDRLVLRTAARVPLTGEVELVPFAAGADPWVIAVSPNEPLVGDLAQNVPWLFLAGGLVAASLAAAIVETLARRRTYALALVDERTGDLRATLDELGETRAFLEHLLSSGPVVVTRTSAADLHLTHVSANIERIFGLSERDALAHGYLAGRIHPDDLPEFEGAMQRLIARDAQQEVIEHRLRHGDGEFRSCTTTAIPEIDADREIVAFLSYTVDVSARRRAEEAQRQAQEAAEAANKAKSEFLSRMSHELRTPLNAVLGFGQLLELEDLDEGQRDAVEHILKAGGHLLDLINEVLDISRIEAGEMSLSPEPVLAADLVQEAADLIRPLADQRGIQLVVDGSGACHCYMYADRQRAKQVLLNLLSNAVKYNRPGGTVAVTCEQSSDTRLQISVEDTGGGIAAERLGLLFTPFERLGAEHTGEEGTGIGLALSRRLAEAMGGTLEAASTLGRGSTFTVELPRVEGQVERYERLHRDAVSAAPSPHRRVVLHIEDNLSNATLVERVLAQRPGVEVVAAMHGRLGLELAREHHPALVLLDLHLPDMDGEQVLQRLREDPVTASIPVVIVSADVTAGQVQRLLSAGASAYLTKPIDVRELLRHVDEAITDT